MCDFILIISKGKLVASDTPGRLEEKMSGTETVEILAKASAAEVRAILLNVEHISNIHTQERADKTCSARIQTEGGCDIREALFFAFAKNECPLLELQTSRISLEEVFLELTQNDAVGEEERTNAGNKRELKSYFHSMTGCVFIAFLVMFTGIYFMAYNLNAGYPYFSYTLSGSLIVFLVGIPLLTMRSFSEERKTKTDQLLLTAPLSLTKVVLGKYFAMVTVLAVPNVIFCLFPLLIKLQGTAYLLVDYSSIAVFFLLGCVYLAIGMFMSSLTESQIIAFISTFGILLLLYL